MGELTNADRLKEDGTCTFCGMVQPLLNVNCEKCGKRLPLPRPRFSDELGPVSSFLLAVGLTLFFVVAPPVLIWTLSPEDSLLWIFSPIYLAVALVLLLLGGPDDEELGTALSTPDYTDSGKAFNSHADSVMTMMLFAIPFNATRAAWASFFRAISDD